MYYFPSVRHFALHASYKYWDGKQANNGVSFDPVTVMHATHTLTHCVWQNCYACHTHSHTVYGKQHSISEC